MPVKRRVSKARGCVVTAEILDLYERGRELERDGHAEDASGRMTDEMRDISTRLDMLTVARPWFTGIFYLSEGVSDFRPELDEPGREWLSAIEEVVKARGKRGSRK